MHDRRIHLATGLALLLALSLALPAAAQQDARGNSGRGREIREFTFRLDVAAPDVQRGSRSRTYVASAGAATLYLQLVDSVSGDVIGRAADRRVARQPGGQITWSNRVSNVAEARRHLGVWADTLVDFLTSHYYQPVPGDDESAEGAGTP